MNNGSHDDLYVKTVAHSYNTHNYHLTAVSLSSMKLFSTFGFVF